MKDLVKFEFQGKGIRTVVIDGNPYWVAKDIAEVLGYKDTVNAVKQHCRGVVKRHPIVDALGRTQEARVIGEPDLYRLIAHSKLPAAVEFERWIFEEVLPQIRKTGKYEVQKTPQTYIEALEALVIAEKEKQKLIENNTELEIKLDEAKEWYSIKRMEKLNFPRKFNWRELKRESHRLKKPIKKVFDQNYGEVNAYHSSVWESLYFDTLNF